MSLVLATVALAAALQISPALEVEEAEEDPKVNEIRGTLEFYCPPSCTVEQSIRMAADRYGVSEVRLRCLVFRESTNRPGAQNGPYLGLAQFDATTWQLTPYRDYARTNAWASVHAVAYLISIGQGSRWPIWRYC